MKPWRRACVWSVAAALAACRLGAAAQETRPCPGAEDARIARLQALAVSRPQPDARLLERAVALAALRERASAASPLAWVGDWASPASTTAPADSHRLRQAVVAALWWTWALDATLPAESGAGSPMGDAEQALALLMGGEPIAPSLRPGPAEWLSSSAAERAAALASDQPAHAACAPAAEARRAHAAQVDRTAAVRMAVQHDAGQAAQWREAIAQENTAAHDAARAQWRCRMALLADWLAAER